MNLNYLDAYEMDIQDILQPAVLASILEDDIIDICNENNESKEKRKLSTRASAPRERNRGFAVKEMEILSDKEFTRMFRLSRSAFEWLLAKIAHHIQPQASLRNNVYHNLKREIPPRTRLAVTLRWLAGGSYLDICFAFGISSSSFFVENGVLWGTMAAIDAELQIGFPLYDAEKLEEISEGFAKFTDGREEV